MISGVIANLSCDAATRDRAIRQIEMQANLEKGVLIDGRKLPITIESGNNDAMEATTRWLQSLDGVEFVDVVFVHLET